MKNNRNANANINRNINKGRGARIGAIVAVLAVASFAAAVAWGGSTTQQSDPAIAGPGTPPCGGSTYYARANMTNGFGMFWLTPTGNISSCTFTDATGLASPYSSALSVTRKSDFNSWCSNNTHGLVFPATNTDSYSLTMYVTSKTPTITNGQPMILKATWH
jgi:hypothetical protein